VVAAYNDFRGVPEPALPASALDGGGNLAVAPLFAAPDLEDYRLAPDSPGIDAGDPSPAFNDPDGSPNDIGAFGGPDGDWVPLPPLDP
jgi:hypothetical protein